MPESHIERLVSTMLDKRTLDNTVNRLNKRILKMQSELGYGSKYYSALSKSLFNTINPNFIEMTGKTSFVEHSLIKFKGDPAKGQQTPILTRSMKVWEKAIEKYGEKTIERYLQNIESMPSLRDVRKNIGAEYEARTGKAPTGTVRQMSDELTDLNNAISEAWQYLYSIQDEAEVANFFDNEATGQKASDDLNAKAVALAEKYKQDGLSQGTTVLPDAYVDEWRKAKASVLNAIDRTLIAYESQGIDTTDAYNAFWQLKNAKTTDLTLDEIREMGKRF